MVYPAEASIRWRRCEAVAEERCTALYGVPTMFIAELDHPEFAQVRPASLRTGIMAGAPCPIEVMKQVQSADAHARGHDRLRHDRDLARVNQCATDDPLERRVSTVGRVQPHLEVKIVDAEGSVVPRGETGELCTRGYSVMHGYWNDAEKTARRSTRRAGCTPATSRRWTREGYCNIVGRLKDMVIRGGENVYPREIEEFLYRHPKIQDVQVVGVPDPKYGEELCAWVKLRRRRDGDRGGDPRVLPGPDRALQDPALRRVRRRVPDDGHRQDPEVRDARADDREAGAEGEKTA